MELVKEHATRNSTLCLIQPHSYHETEFSDNENPKNSSHSSPSSTNSNGHQGNQSLTPYHPEDAHNSFIHFNSHHAHGYGNFANASGSLFTFERSNSSFPCNQEDYAIWEDNSHPNFASPTSSVIPFGWLSSTETSPSVDIKNVSQEEPCSMNKRPFAGESTQDSKKQCNGAKTVKPKSTASGSPSKDPQSVAAKNRRERISERLKILQDLVPNGTKVDLVTMLEKAISYVKFLQLQVKVLATDEFWAAQGAKAPDVSQVKEAIDAILASSQRERNSSSSKVIETAPIN